MIAARSKLALCLCVLLCASVSNDDESATTVPTDDPPGVVWHTYEDDQGTLEYGLLLPRVPEGEERFPALVVFHTISGGMTPEDALEGLWAAEAVKRGWIVVAPKAPNGSWFFEHEMKRLQAALEEIMRNHPIEEDRFHVAGAYVATSHALHLAAAMGEQVVSVLGMPAFLLSGEEFENLQKVTRETDTLQELRSKAVAIFCWSTPGMYPSAHDQMIDWCENAHADAQVFSAHGQNADVFEHEGPANAEALFDWLDKQRSLPQRAPQMEDE